MALPAVLSARQLRFASCSGVTACQSLLTRPGAAAAYRARRGARHRRRCAANGGRNSRRDGACLVAASMQATEHGGGGGDGGVGEPGGALLAEQIWPRVVSTYLEACQTGAISRINSTASTVVERVEGGAEVPWVLRLAAILKNKPTADSTSKVSAKERPAFVNPFDPPERELTVGHLSDTHTLVLNKFNVVQHHTIVITRTFQPQTDPLNKRDLEATYAVLRSMPEGGVGFFNCGEHSGRSQPHKHVQIVPLPFLDGQPATLPTAAMLLGDAEGKAELEVSETRSLPFRGYFCKLPPAASGEQLETAFQELLRRASADTPKNEPLSYNWLGCQDFMALFPRSREKMEMLAVNALGFAGTFLCRSDDEVAFAKTMGCINILKAVGQPW